MRYCVGSSRVGYLFTSRLWDIDCLLHEVDSQLFKGMQNCQHCIKYLLPDTRITAYITRRKKTTHMNSRIIITAGLGVPLSTGPSTILFDIWFLYYITLNWYTINVLITYSHVCTYTFCCVYLIKIDQSANHLINYRQVTESMDNTEQENASAEHAAKVTQWVRVSEQSLTPRPTHYSSFPRRKM